MLDLLLEVIDRLIQLKNYRTEKLEKTFEDIFKPTFEDLLEVHSDYIKMFEDVSRELPQPSEIKSAAGREKLASVAESFRQRRIEFEPVRIQLTAMIRELLGSRYGKQKKLFDGKAQEFLDAVVNYFPEGYLMGSNGSSRSTVLYTAIRSSANAITVEQVEKEGEMLPNLISDTIAECRENWACVCEKYASLRLAVKTA